MDYCFLPGTVKYLWRLIETIKQNGLSNHFSGIYHTPNPDDFPDKGMTQTAVLFYKLPMMFTLFFASIWSQLLQKKYFCSWICEYVIGKMNKDDYMAIIVWKTSHLLAVRMNRRQDSTVTYHHYSLCKWSPYAWLRYPCWRYSMFSLSLNQLTINCKLTNKSKSELLCKGNINLD